MKLTNEQYKKEIEASKEVFKAPVNLLEKRDKLFDRQLEILSMVNHDIIKRPGQIRDTVRNFGRKKLSEEYKYNQIELKNIDKEIMQVYEYKVCENNSLKNN